MRVWGTRMLVSTDDTVSGSRKRASVHVGWLYVNFARSHFKSYPSIAAMYEEPVVVVGQDTRRSDLQASYIQLTRPFDRWAWVLIVGFYSFVCAVHVAKSCHFANPKSPMNVFRHIFGDYTQSNNTEPVRLLNIAASRTLRTVVGVSALVIVLFSRLSLSILCSSACPGRCRRIFAIFRRRT